MGEIVAVFGESESKEANYRAILAEEGIVEEFSQEALNEALCRILGDREALSAYKMKQTQTGDNNKALAQFRNLTDM